MPLLEFRNTDRNYYKISLLLSAFAISITPSVATAQASHPICQLSDSDSDGDGWGWENKQSCVVQHNNDNTIYCLDPSSDPDGDGWGWENNQSCVVKGSIAVKPATPICSTADADPDGDGWGWENSASCLVDNNVTPKRPAEITDLILVTGQSNTLGANTSVSKSLDAPHPRVMAYTNEGWQTAELYQVWDQGGHPGTGDRDATAKIHNNFALHFGKRLAELDENAVVGIILVSEPGMGIRNWDSGAPGMLRIQKKVLAAINALPHKSALDGILWHQGETDWQYEGTSDVLAEQPAPDNYYPSRFAALLENLRLENWFSRNAPFICGETIKAHGVNEHLNSLNSDDDDSTACIEGAGLPSVVEGGNHFNAYALRILGQRYAEQYNLMR